MAVQNFNGGISLILRASLEWRDSMPPARYRRCSRLRPARGQQSDRYPGVWLSGRPGRRPIRRLCRAGVSQSAEYHAPLTPTGEEQAILEESRRLYYQKLTVVRTRQGLEEVLAFTDAHLQPGISAPLRKPAAAGAPVRHGRAGPHREPGHPLSGGLPGQPNLMAPTPGVFRRGTDGMPELCPGGN